VFADPKLPECLVDCGIRVLGSDSSRSEFGAKPAAAGRTESNPVPHERKGKCPVIDVAEFVTPVDRGAGSFLRVAFPAQVAQQLQPASGAIGKTVQSPVERFSPACSGTQGLQFRLVQNITFAERPGQDYRVGQQSPRLTIELELDPTGSATRGQAGYSGHESTDFRPVTCRS